LQFIIRYLEDGAKFFIFHSSIDLIDKTRFFAAVCGFIRTLPSDFALLLVQLYIVDLRDVFCGRHKAHIKERLISACALRIRSVLIINFRFDLAFIGIYLLKKVDRPAHYEL